MDSMKEVSPTFFLPVLLRLLELGLKAFNEISSLRKSLLIKHLTNREDAV